MLGGEKLEARKAGTSLEINYKKLTIMTDPGPLLNDNGMPTSKKEKSKEDKVVSKINKFKPHLIFVGISAPKQEKWLHRNIKSIDVGGAMVVGGTFKYISGQSKMPPEIISNIGLEWFWRLITGSQNIERIITSVVLFPWTVFKYKLNSKSTS